VNRASLSLRAAWRTRSRSLDTLKPALRPGRVSLAAFPLPGPLPSTASAAASTALFDSFAGTTGPSDFRRSFITGLRPRPSPHGPPQPFIPALSGRLLSCFQVRRSLLGDCERAQGPRDR
jgi:hypothetical protein